VKPAAKPSQPDPTQTLIGSLLGLLLGVAGLPSLPLGLGISLILSYYWTVLLGMPWSLWGWGLFEPVAALLCALLNVGLVSLAFVVAYRRKRRQATEQVSAA